MQLNSAGRASRVLATRRSVAGDAACGFVFAKAPGYEADDFLAAAVADEERLKDRRQLRGELKSVTVSRMFTLH